MDAEFDKLLDDAFKSTVANEATVRKEFRAKEKEKRHSFRIRRIYYDQIVAGTKKFELRKASLRNVKLLLGENPPKIATFICGKLVHRRWITKIETIRSGKVAELLGRPASDQGTADLQLNSKPFVICTWLGDEFGARNLEEFN